MLMELDYAATCIFSYNLIITCAVIHCFHTRFLHEGTVYSHSHILPQLRGTQEKRFHFVSLLLFGLNIADA